MSIRTPKRLKQRPQYRGLPIPYVTFIDDNGKPDFRVTDEAKRQSIMANARCQLCGQMLGKYMFFVGGTAAADANAYFEPACHLDCLIYAMQVCPFIAGKLEHADIEKVKRDHSKTELGRFASGMMIKDDDTMSIVKNPYWVIKKATGYRFVKAPGGTILNVPEVVKATQPIHAETMTGAEWAKVMKWLME